MYPAGFQMHQHSRGKLLSKEKPVNFEEEMITHLLLDTVSAFALEGSLFLAVVDT